MGHYKIYKNGEDLKIVFELGGYLSYGLREAILQVESKQKVCTLNHNGNFIRVTPEDLKKRKISSV